jgi:hypothetical protein
MTGWPLWLQLAMLLVGPVLAVIAHELTHYVTIWPVAETVDVEVDLAWRGKFEVVYELYNDPWRMWWADMSNLSPLLIGLSIMGYLLTIGFPWSIETLWVAPTWLFYSVGGAADFARVIS